jgi:vacuolar-type H+-ATPase subunit H
VDLYHDSTPHIKEQIHAKYEAKRQTLLHEARHDAKQHIAAKKQEAEEDGETHLANAQRQADKAAQHKYHKEKTALTNTIQAEKQDLRDDLRSAVWDELSLDDETINNYLRTTLRQSVEANNDTLDNYTITIHGDTPRTKMIRATDNTKHYEVRFDNLVSQVIEDYWADLV